MFDSHSPETQVRKMYKKLAPMIVADAAKNNIKLDYTIGSLKSVESILSSLHQEYVTLGRPRSPEVEESYHGYAEMLGSYMLAVVDKNRIPGRLTIVNDQYGVSFGFTFASGSYSDFMSWCHKAILNGKSDAILPKFAFYSKH